MHQHCGSVALQIPQLAMGYGGSRKDGIAVLAGGAGLAQAKSQVFNQRREMSRALLITKRNAVQVTALSRPRQPVFDDTANAPPQHHAHSLLVQPFSSFAIDNSFSDQFGELPNLEWFHHDFVRF